MHLLCSIKQLQVAPRAGICFFWLSGLGVKVDHWLSGLGVTQWAGGEGGLVGGNKCLPHPSSWKLTRKRTSES